MAPDICHQFVFFFFFFSQRDVKQSKFLCLITHRHKKHGSSYYSLKFRAGDAHKPFKYDTGSDVHLNTKAWLLKSPRKPGIYLFVKIHIQITITHIFYKIQITHARMKREA